jgi:hypothetical protein
MRKSRYGRVAVLAVPCALALGACGGSSPTIAQHSEKSLAQTGLEKVTNTPAKSIDCPTGVQAKVGVTFDCHLTMNDGTQFLFTERVDQVSGKQGRLEIVRALKKNS